MSESCKMRGAANLLRIVGLLLLRNTVMAAQGHSAGSGLRMGLVVTSYEYLEDFQCPAHPEMPIMARSRRSTNENWATRVVCRSAMCPPARHRAGGVQSKRVSELRRTLQNALSYCCTPCA